MEVQIVMPRLGNDVEEAEINEWLKMEGEAVNEGEVLIMITTPKVSMEIESPATGTLKKIVWNAGEIVPIGTTVGIIETSS